MYLAETRKNNRNLLAGTHSRRGRNDNYYSSPLTFFFAYLESHHIINYNITFNIIDDTILCSNLIFNPFDRF